MTDRMLLVFTNAVEGQDDAFNAWYDTQHLSDILAVPGIVAAQRYELAPLAIPEGVDAPADAAAPAHRYLAVYELDRDPDDVMKDFVSLMGTDRMQLSESFDLSTAAVAPWTARGARRTAD